ncbi:MAG: S41 family peptidase [Epsilonproteobacteria bacterium]|nr:S41 family peptidase [Campylobacterota bacterium]
MKRKVIVAVLLIAFVITAGTSLLRAGGSDQYYGGLRTFTNVLSIIKADYVEKVDSQKLITGAIRGMVGTLDPHSAYFTSKEYKEFQTITTGEFGGLGMTVTLKDGILTVVSPIEDTPAARAGIKANDKIIRIDGKNTPGMSLNKAVSLLRGKPGTKVTISILRKGKHKPIVVTITREIIHVKSVKHKMLKDKIGYIKILQFQENTGRNVKRAIKALKKKGAIDLILDLRNNPGGLLSQAVSVSDAFLTKGTIVSIRGRKKVDTTRFIAHDDGNEPTGNMVVLINGGSASAAEIVTGALKDNKRAIIMGQKSFGKGSVQTLIPLDNGGALKLTTAKYYTPNGKSIQAVGITPDISVPDKLVLAKKNSALTRIREVDLPHHFAASQKINNSKTLKQKKRLMTDYQLERAVDLLIGLRIAKGIDAKEKAK